MFHLLPDGKTILGIRDGAVCGLWEGERYPEGGFFFKRSVHGAQLRIEEILEAFEGDSVHSGGGG